MEFNNSNSAVVFVAVVSTDDAAEIDVEPSILQASSHSLEKNDVVNSTTTTSPPPPPPSADRESVVMKLDLGFYSLMRVFSMMYLDLYDLGRIARTSSSFNMETERAAKSMLLDSCVELNIMPWVAEVSKGPHMERVGGRTFKRVLWEMTRNRIMICGGFGGLARADVMDVTRNLLGLGLGVGVGLEPTGVASVGWELCPPMSRDRSYFGAIYRRGEVVVIHRGIVERYSSFSKKWVESEGRMPHSHKRISACMFGGKIHVSGGFVDNSQGLKAPTRSMVTLGDHSVFSPRYSHFTTSSSRASVAVAAAAATAALSSSSSIAQWELEAHKHLIQTRKSHAMAVLNNRLWIAGGMDDFDQIMSTVEVFDPEVGSMVLTHNRMTRRRFHFSLVVVDNELYAVGGDWTLVLDGGLSIEKMENGIDGEWKVVTEYGGGGPRFESCAVAVGHKIFVLGGASLL